MINKFFPFMVTGILAFTGGISPTQVRSTDGINEAANNGKWKQHN